ncbi:MAG TPA: 3-deoxy-7-phosphoheptulonate synthase [Pyrinomonadaceae bacterium]|nr:3-deoxy-7-phosphoheptulonate synthase [Pyrinomonadaceae bacterium]
MIVNMQNNATPDEISHIVERIKECGFQAHVVEGAERTIIGAIGSSGRRSEIEALRAAPGVADVIQISHPFKLVSRQLRQTRTVVDVRGIKIGNGDIVVIAGPCSVESEEQLMETAHAVKASGASMLRGGAYKPRTSPYDFQGLGVEALRFLRQASRETGLPIVTEVMSEADVEIVEEYADMMQVGARNMQNFSLLRKLARVSKPVLLKRGPSATVKEWLLAAEYLLAGGNADVVLCERGIKTFETATRNTLDLAAVALVKELSHLPVLADPSHGTGLRSLISPMSKAAVAVGADGLLIEVHPCPERALSDGPQSLDLPGFQELMENLGQPRICTDDHRSKRAA